MKDKSYSVVELFDGKHDTDLKFHFKNNIQKTCINLYTIIHKPAIRKVRMLRNIPSISME